LDFDNWNLDFPKAVVGWGDAKPPPPAGEDDWATQPKVGFGRIRSDSVGLAWIGPGARGGSLRWNGLSARMEIGAWFPGALPRSGMRPRRWRSRRGNPGQEPRADGQCSRRGGWGRAVPTPPPAKRQGFRVRPSGDGLCQRARDGIQPSVAGGSALREPAADDSPIRGRRTACRLENRRYSRLGNLRYRCRARCGRKPFWPQTASTLSRFRENVRY
jgi:hypothetical protein